ncbi:endoplasmic reticulum-golgi intermediate compartment protein 3 [Westerdykella ornata]|uniref:Endoplasmic reticulum-Golgi intermediate compartment protein n=1 Tax=Westerdykella ornata TaxID=318751 RepID=A0A6A6JZ54_WESOR|nr:endoplasmic reticulum-golgi intermediate compartment protein 3 [Westerdykella ornata]KAF2281363.1 endoplasmic reticulum-golgi intermediate compartment protein 3 [Westerdykella ornata]
MPAKSRFTRLDAFTKTVEDARIRTTSGGIVTIASLIIILWLAWGEWADYRKVIVRPELIVDKGRGEKMEIAMNITFPRMPCELLTLDVMDVSGELQMGVNHGINKVRLSPESEGSKVIETKALELHKEEAQHLAPDYCGECYGAPPPATASKPGCCNTCDEVRDAYASVSWSFGRGEGVEQCEREHYAEHLDEQRREGCRIEGSIRVNKVIGNFHIAPGKSFSNGNLHVHDLENYFKDATHTFTHRIHHLRFGPQLSDAVIQDMQKKHQNTGPGGWTNHHINPLDNTEQHTEDKTFNFMYFIKVVSTAYLPLGWEKEATRPSKHDDLLGATIDGSYKGSIETHQYSVTSHKRSLTGGPDEEGGHKERIHARGGIPGVFFSYDISPMKVINREVRPKTFSGFLVGLCAVVGGTLTVAAAVDRALYEGVNRVRKLHSN